MIKLYLSKIISLLAFYILGISCTVYGIESKQANIANEIRAILEAESYYIQAPFPKNWKKWNIDQLKNYIFQHDPWASLEIGTIENQSLLGIGAKLYRDSGKLWLLPYHGGSLMHSGVSSRIQLLSIDDDNVEQLELDEVGNKFRKSLGQPIKLGFCIINTECNIPQHIYVTRQPFKYQSVEYTRLAGRNIIRILSFDQNTPKKIQKILTEKYSPSINSVNNPILIDLRDNSGGDLYAMIETLDFLLQKGDEIITLSDKKHKSRTFYAQSGASESLTYPILVLVSKKTASAGEIFAGVLKYYGFAIVIGENTYGKCVSQTEKKLSDGKIFIFTNLEVRLPKDTPCNQIGILPQRVLNHTEIYNSRYLGELFNKISKASQ